LYNQASKGDETMPNLHLGSLIKKLRKKKGLTQEALAHPFIDRATLSKIENGKVMPNRSTMETLFERLGYNAHTNIDSFLGGEEAKIQKIIDELDSLTFNESAPGNAEARYKRAAVLVKALEGNKAFTENLKQRQYLMIRKASILIFGKNDNALGEALLLQALALSIPDFDPQRIEDFHLSKNEMSALNLLAKIYFDKGRGEDAINHLYSLKNNIEKHCVDKNAYGYLYPAIIYNLAAFLNKEERYEESLKMCDHAIEICKDTAQFRTLPLVVGYKAGNLLELGAREECERLVKQVFYSSEMFGLYGQRELAREFARERLGLEL